MTKSEYLEFCRSMPLAAADSPFEGDFETVIARHGDTGKWFAAVMRYMDRDIVNLKCEPMEGEFLRKIYSGIIPAYHMNKRHWITVFLDGDVPDGELCRLTEESYRLTGKKTVDKRR